MDEAAKRSVAAGPVSSGRLATLLWLVGAAALYGATAAREPVWADASKLTLYALHGYWPSLNPGDHAGWVVQARLVLVMLGWIGPVRAMHLLSALAGAVSVALLHGTVRSWTGDRERAHAAAAVLLVAHGPWWASTVAETYMPAVALVMVVARLSRSRGRAARLGAGAAAGLALATHAFSIILTAPLLVWSLSGRRAGAQAEGSEALELGPQPGGAWRRRLLAAALLAAGMALGTMPLWLGLIGTPADPLTGHVSAGAGSWSWHLAAFIEPRRMLRGALVLGALVCLNLGPLGLLGLLRAARRPGAAAHPRPGSAAVALVLLGLVLTTYSAYRLHLMTIFLVVGLLLLVPPRLGTGLRTAHVILQAAGLVMLPVLLGLLGYQDLGVRRAPGRNAAAYFLSPVKTLGTGADQYARSLLEAAPPRAVILADFNLGAPLRLVQETEDLRPDLEIVPTAVDDAMARPDPTAALAEMIQRQLGREPGVNGGPRPDGAGRPVVLADSWEPYYHTVELRQRFGLRIVPCGPGWLVTAGHETALPESADQPFS